MDRLFVIVGRINNILLLLVLLGAGLFVGYMSWSSSHWQPRGAIEVPAGEHVSNATLLLRFGQIENIRGADTQMIRLTTQGKSGGNSRRAAMALKPETFFS